MSGSIPIPGRQSQAEDLVGSCEAGEVLAEAIAIVYRSIMLSLILNECATIVFVKQMVFLVIFTQDY